MYGDYPDVAQAQAAIDSYQQERDELEKQENLRRKAASAATAAANSRRHRAHGAEPQVSAPTAAVPVKNRPATRRQIAGQTDGDRRPQAEPGATEKEIDEYNRRLQSARSNEQQYTALLRDFNLAKDDYDDMIKRQRAVRNGAELEEHKAGENLEVLDPADCPSSLPSRTGWPGRASEPSWAWCWGWCWRRRKEMKNTSLKNLKDVRAYTNLPVLSSIPLLENALLVRRKRRLVWLAWSSAFIIGCI